MKMTVYIDLLILVNFLVNYFLIKLAAVLSGCGVNTVRILISAFVGSLFSVIILFDIPVLLSIWVKIISVICCSVISFGFEKKYLFVKRTVILLSVYMLFCGLLQMLFENSSYIYINNCSFYLSINPVWFVTAVVIFYIIFSFAEMVLFQHPKNCIYDMEVFAEFGSFSAISFYDTGFRVKDIMCFNPVMMCSVDFLRKAGFDDISDKIERFYNGETERGIIPLFYSDITGGGMLAAIKTNKVIIKKNKKEIKNVLLAVSKKEFSNERQIIFGKDFYDRFGD